MGLGWDEQDKHDGPHEIARKLGVVVVSEPSVVADAVMIVVQSQPDLLVVDHVRPSVDIAAIAARCAPDALVVAFGGPRGVPISLVDGVRELRKTNPGLGIVVIADQMSDFGFALLSTGTGRVAFLLDHRATEFGGLPDAIREVCGGGHILDSSVVEWLVRRPEGPSAALNGREVDVLQRMAAGRSNKAIAGDLCLSTKSVEKYVTTVFRKLRLFASDMTDRRVLAALAFQRGVTPVLR
jgi:DNA-binding NarL/FixJ family response regulator